MSDAIVDFIAAVFNEYGVPLFESGSPFKATQDAAMNELAAIRAAVAERDAAIEKARAEVDALEISAGHTDGGWCGCDVCMLRASVGYERAIRARSEVKP